MIAADPLEPLLQKAVESGSVEVLERLLTVKRQVQADAARDAFYVALTAFQAACPVIEKSTKAKIESKAGASFSYTYTPLEDIAHAIRSLLERFQLGYRWFVSQSGQSLTVRCRISHALGHIEETELTVPVGVDPMRPAWPVAQSLTYAKRYTLCNALGIVVGGEDDDAQDPQPEPAPKPAAVPTQSASPQQPSTPKGEVGFDVIEIADVQMKSGTKNNKPWTRYGIVSTDGTIYSTFDTDLGDKAVRLKGTTVELSWKRDGKYLNCTEIDAAGHDDLDEAQGWEPGMDG